MEALYCHRLDPRDARSADRSTWGEAGQLGTGPRKFRSADELYRERLAAEPDAGPERRAELRRAAERAARQDVSFYDATFSAPKSVTVVATAFERAENDARRAAERAEEAARVAESGQANESGRVGSGQGPETGRVIGSGRVGESGQPESGRPESGRGGSGQEASGHRAAAARYRAEAEAWAAQRAAVEEAVMAGARAAIEYLQQHAGYSRIGHHGGGAGRWVDAHEFTVAQFLQHDSRDRDPQLHVHQAILSVVQCADGRWRKLDGQLLWAHKWAAAAHGERVMEAHLAMLGLRMETRPDGKAREIVGVPRAVMELFPNGGER